MCGRRAPHRTAYLRSGHPLPEEIAGDDRAQHTIPFYLVDDAQEGRVSQVLLRIKIVDLVSDDRLEIALNGQSLQGEICRREYGYKVAPYQSMWLIFDLQRVRPHQGANRLEIRWWSDRTIW